MNKHIKLVKKYLANPSSVTKAELKANGDAAAAVYFAAYAAYFDADADAAVYAAAAYASAYNAAAYASAYNPAHWVKRYEELSVTKHIELVKKWLDNPSSVTKAELSINADDAFTALLEAVDDVTYALLEAVDDAAQAADESDAVSAAYQVKRYEELSK